MIVISVLKDKKIIYGLECIGHSGYADEGKDIVCAGVSVLTQNAINSIEEMLDLKLITVVDEQKPILKFELPKNLEESQMSIAQIILQSTVLGLKDIAKSYKKYVEIKEIQK